MQLGGGPGGGGGGAIQFMIQGPDLEAAREVQRRAADQGAGDSRTGRRRHHAQRRQARDVGAARSAEGRRPRRAGGRRRRRAAAAGRRRSGDDLQRSRRAVRSAPARRGERTRLRRTPLPALPVPSSRLGIVTLDNIATFATSDSPATISRMGRQRQVTLNANMLPGTSQATAQEAIAAAAAELNIGPEYRADFAGPLARAQSHRHRVPDRDRAVVHLHVSDPGGAVRVVAAPGHDPAVAAADAAVRAALADHLSAVAQHLFGAGPAGAVRRGEEELDSADRPRQPAARRRHEHARRGGAGQPRSPAADPDDDAGVRGGHGAAGGLERRRVRPPITPSAGW